MISRLRAWARGTVWAAVPLQSVSRPPDSSGSAQSGSVVPLSGPVVPLSGSSVVSPPPGGGFPLGGSLVQDSSAQSVIGRSRCRGERPTRRGNQGRLRRPPFVCRVDLRQGYSCREL